MNRHLAWVTLALVLATAAAAVPVLVRRPPAAQLHRTAAARSRALAGTVSGPGIVIQGAHDLSALRVQTRVDAADTGRVRAGQPVRFTVSACPGRIFAGTVAQVRWRPAGTGGALTCTIDIRTRAGALRLSPGTTAEVVILAATRGRPSRLHGVRPRASRTDPGAALAAAPTRAGPLPGRTGLPAGAGGKRA